MLSPYLFGTSGHPDNVFINIPRGKEPNCYQLVQRESEQLPKLGEATRRRATEPMDSANFKWVWLRVSIVETVQPLTEVAEFKPLIPVNLGISNVAEKRDDSRLKPNFPHSGRRSISFSPLEITN